MVLLVVGVAAAPALARTGAVLTDQRTSTWRISTTGEEDPRWPAPDPTASPGPTAAPTADPSGTAVP